MTYWSIFNNFQPSKNSNDGQYDSRQDIGRMEMVVKNCQYAIIYLNVYFYLPVSNFLVNFSFENWVPRLFGFFWVFFFLFLKIFVNISFVTGDIFPLPIPM